MLLVQGLSASTSIGATFRLTRNNNSKTNSFNTSKLIVSNRISGQVFKVRFCAPKPVLSRFPLGVYCNASPVDEPASQGTLSNTPLVVLAEVSENPELFASKIPNSPGVYAVYDPEDTLQYIGISRKVAASVAAHLEDLPELAAGAKVLEVQGGDKDTLQVAWKNWMQEAVAELGSVPSGNKPGERLWLARKRKPAKPELKVTPGKGTEDLTVPVETLVQKMIDTYKVLAFIKGTRTGPECSFSHNLLVMLNECGVEYELVNVMDEKHNPRVREIVKQIAEWPTTPQLYIKGEFMGGAEVVEEMYNSGELKKMLEAAYE